MEFLIGLHGDSRAGKDSVAGFMVQDFDFVQRNMANPIRQILLDLNPLIQDNYGDVYDLKTLFEMHDQNWDKVKAAASDSVDYMIRLGQSCRDNINREVWLNTAMTNRPRRLVIADVRQPNEYETIKAAGGQIWLVTRPGTEKRGMDSLLQGYEFDVRIENRGTLEGLRGQVASYISSQVHGAYVQRVSGEYGVRF